MVSEKRDNREGGDVMGECTWSEGTCSVQNKRRARPGDESERGHDCSDGRPVLKANTLANHGQALGLGKRGSGHPDKVLSAG